MQGGIDQEEASGRGNFKYLDAVMVHAVYASKLLVECKPWFKTAACLPVASLRGLALQLQDRQKSL
jgi:hypothetical protein